MEIFLDTANIDEIREAFSWGIIDGVTTNPSLIAKNGKDFIQMVGDKNHRDTPAFDIGDDVKQPLGFPFGQGRCRFVQDQN